MNVINQVQHAVTKVANISEIFRRNMSVKQFKMADVAQHSDVTSCWIILSDKVYDVTDFIANHPGGEEIILENAGCDATVPFDSKGHSADAYVMMEKYCIGELIEADRRYKN